MPRSGRGQVTEGSDYGSSKNLKEDCRDTLERAYLFLDGEVLTDAERADIRTHLEECRPCYERYGLESEITALLARLRGCQRCPEALRLRITALFRT
jgi:mycothiol system anti-sigma-R factor